MTKNNPSINESNARHNRLRGVRKFRWKRKCRECGAKTYIGNKHFVCVVCLQRQSLPPEPAPINAHLEDRHAYMPTQEEIEAACAIFRKQKQRQGELLPDREEVNGDNNRSGIYKTDMSAAEMDAPVVWSKIQ